MLAFTRIFVSNRYLHVHVMEEKWRLSLLIKDSQHSFYVVVCMVLKCTSTHSLFNEYFIAVILVNLAIIFTM